MKEPTLLPTTYPNILVSANTGIAVGMAVSYTHLDVYKRQGRHQGFYPLNSHFLLFLSLAQIADM